jgi:hypothetical protein
VGEAKQEAAKVAQTPVARGLARWGLISKGALYLVVGAIAGQVALLDQGTLESRAGALEAVADEPLGAFLVAALAVGLFGYAFWRVAEGLLGRPLEGGEQETVWRRLGLVARGVWYLGLCGLAVAVLAGANESAGSQDEDRITGRALDLPAGQWIVGAVGLAIVGAGVLNVYRGLTGRFKENMKLRKMSPAEENAFTIIGGIGFTARGVVFGLIGFFLARAAYQYDPEEAVGLDGALAKLLQQRYGAAWLAAVGLGLIAFAVYCFAEARYREV